MKQSKPDWAFRPTSMEDGPHLIEWLSNPAVLRGFPMFDAKEIEDAVRIWLGYSRILAGLTAELNGQPVGMANLYIQPYKKLAHTCLFSIIIKEEYRGRGLGAHLLRNLMKLAKERFQIEILHLEVYQGNPAKKLYDRLGFKEFGSQAHFIKENGTYLSKIMMQKPLN